MKNYPACKKLTRQLLVSIYQQHMLQTKGVSANIEETFVLFEVYCTQKDQ